MKHNESSLIFNLTNTLNDEFWINRDPLHVVVPVTVIYTIIFITGILGNTITCVVIARNKHMHTATNYYLFSLAVSDILLLSSGLPSETFSLWSKHQFIFSESFCVIKGFVAETSSNATVLTITAFTVERYLAICHPFRSFSLSKLSRAVFLILFIWIVSALLAVPMAVQFGILREPMDGFEASYCAVKAPMIKAFVVSSFIVFVLPMTVISVLYVLIALKLKISGRMSSKRPSVCSSGGSGGRTRTSRVAAHQQHVIKMLVAVVVAFFICWAPFHAQRLFALHMKDLNDAGQLSEQPALLVLYDTLLHISGILYFLSTTVNPLLYNIMSLKFRMAFKSTLSKTCCLRESYEVSRSPIGTVKLSSTKIGNGYNNKTSTTTVLTQVRRIKTQPPEAKQADLHNSPAILQVYETQIALNPNLNANHAPDIGKSKKEAALRCITRRIRFLPSKRIFCHKSAADADAGQELCLHKNVAGSLTVSNSSLLDLDPSEFNSSELADIISAMKTDTPRETHPMHLIIQTNA